MARVGEESKARHKAEERAEASAHKCSILQLDLKAAQDDVREAKQALATVQSKVGGVTYCYV